MANPLLFRDSSITACTSIISSIAYNVQIHVGPMRSNVKSRVYSRSSTDLIVAVIYDDPLTCRCAPPMEMRIKITRFSRERTGIYYILYYDQVNVSSPSICSKEEALVQHVLRETSVSEGSHFAASENRTKPNLRLLNYILLHLILSGSREKA